MRRVICVAPRLMRALEISSLRYRSHAAAATHGSHCVASSARTALALGPGSGRAAHLLKCFTDRSRRTTFWPKTLTFIGRSVAIFDLALAVVAVRRDVRGRGRLS